MVMMDWTKKNWRNDMNEDDYYICSNCGELIMEEEKNEDTCPNCGSEDLDFFEG